MSTVNLKLIATNVKYIKLLCLKIRLIFIITTNILLILVQKLFNSFSDLHYKKEIINIFLKK